MRDVVVGLSSEVGLQELAQTLSDSPFEVTGPSDGRLSVLANDDVVQFELDDALLEHYEEPEELKSLALLGPGPHFFLVTFKSAQMLGKVLRLTVNRVDAVVDNDFGLIESGRDFVRRFQENPNWDWIAQPKIPTSKVS